MAGGAHGIPVHAAAGPVAPIAGGAWVVISINVEPFVLRGVEGDVADLHPPAGCGDEKLAQWVVPDDSDDGVGVAIFLESLGEKFREAIRIDEGLGGVLAVGEGLLGGEGWVVFFLLDGPLSEAVMRVLPFLKCSSVALAARFRAGVGGVDFVVWSSGTGDR